MNLQGRGWVMYRKAPTSLRVRSRSYLLSQLSQPVGLTEAKEASRGRQGGDSHRKHKQKATSPVRNEQKKRAKDITI